MQPMVCTKVGERFFLASRTNKIGAVISKDKYDELIGLSNENGALPKWMAPLLKMLKPINSEKVGVNDFFLFRQQSNYRYCRVSYEITERCNYNCRHCYLDEKKSSTLDRSAKESILRTISESGSLWLQLTGGEPLFDPDFKSIYSLSHSLGMLIVLCTNGSLLTDKKISQLLAEKLPYRLTISVYGASKSSYESLTRKSGSFEKFKAGLDWAKEVNARTRLNIIVSKYNEHEVGEMERLAQSYGFEYFIYYSMAPTLNGSLAPLNCEACDYANQAMDSDKDTDDRYVQCQAGHTSFHVDCRGQACICKAIRQPYVDILKFGSQAFVQLADMSNMLFKTPSDCTNCGQRNVCATCPLLYGFYKKSEYMPISLCRKIQQERR